MITVSRTNNRFTLDMQSENQAIDSVYRLMRPGLERLLAFDQLNRISLAAEEIADGDSPENRILRVLDARCSVEAADLDHIPEEGPCIVVANHPFGGIEGLLLASLLKRKRPDVKIMANYMLGQIGQLRELFILVDPFGTTNSTKANIAGMKEALRWLAGGGVLGIFPAGEVSHFDPGRGDVSDPAWSASIGRLVQRSGAPVLPLYFEGQNGPLFQMLGMLHPVLRTARLPHEFVNKRGLRIAARIAAPIPPERLARFKTPSDLAAYLRIRTYLQKRTVTTKDLPPPHAPEKKVIPAVDPALLRHDIAALPDTALLVTHENFRVYAAEANVLPSVLREIGRLREVTFRENNEGTGNEIDLDRFDSEYLHLFLWNQHTSEIVAAYRLGQTDIILAKQGKRGLYTRTLFNIRKRLLKQISPALEMGRSFVRIEYQRHFLPLMLLWRGIGTYVSRNPRYRNLFGPVSINSTYSSTSQQLLVQFLSRHSMDSRARFVRAKTPLVSRRIQGFDPDTMSTVARDISELSNLISDIEADHKELPVLLRQYLKLGGVLLGFNVDPDFSDVLDGLILVDLTKTDPRLLERYMGKEAAASFLEHWKEG